MKKIKKQFNKLSKIAIICLGIVFVLIISVMGLKIVLAAWVEPQVPPPSDNIYTPIDVGNNSQVMMGKLLIDPSFNPYGAVPNLSKSLEVRGSALFGSLLVDNNLAVGSNNFFLVDGTYNRVGIGTNIADLSQMASKLTVLNDSGAGVYAGTSTSTGIAISAYSSSEHAVYGETAAGGMAGIKGENIDDNSGIGVYGESTNGAGVYGYSESASGVAGYTSGTSSESAAIYGQIPLTSLSWAGYFKGRIFSSDEVIGSRFAPLKLQNSLIPYTSAQIISLPQRTSQLADNTFNMAFDGTNIWAINMLSSDLFKFRASDGKILLRTNVMVGGFSANPYDIVFDGSNIWVSDFFLQNVIKYDLEGNEIAQYITGLSPPGSYHAMTFDGPNIWTANWGDKSISRINRESGAVNNFSVCPLCRPSDIIFDGENIWVGFWEDNFIAKYDRNGNQIESITISEATGTNFIHFDGKYIWVADWFGDKIFRFNPISKTYDKYNFLGPSAFASDGLNIWVGQDTPPYGGPASQILQQISAYDGTVLRQYVLDGRPIMGLLYDGTYVWVSTHIDIFRLYAGSGFGKTNLANSVALPDPYEYNVPQSGSFSIAGTGIMSGDLKITGDINAPNNVWGGTQDNDVSYNVGCKDGEFVKGVTVNLGGVGYQVRWERDGVHINNNKIYNQAPYIVSDGYGGAIIVWKENKWEYAVKAQRIDSNGNLLWNPEKEIINLPTGDQGWPKIIASGVDNFIIDWIDDRNGNIDIYAQKIDINGNDLWALNGVPVVDAPNSQGGYYQEGLKFMPDSYGGAFFAWEDSRNVSGNYNVDIYVQRINSNGVRQWGADLNGLQASDDSSDPRRQHMPDITSDGYGGFIVAWADCINEESTGCNGPTWPGGLNASDVYVNRFTLSGSKPWAIINNGNGIKIKEKAFAPAIVSTSDIGGLGEPGAIITFGRDGPDKNNIFGIKSSDGSIVWQQKITTNSEWYGEGVIRAVSDGEGGMVAVYRGQPAAWHTVQAQRVDKNGNILWGALNGLIIRQDTSAFGNTQLVLSGDGKFIVTWYDERDNSANSRIYAQKIDKEGSIVWPTNGVALSLASGAKQCCPQIASDMTGGAIVTWEDARGAVDSGDDEIYAQRVTDASTLLCRPL